MLGCLEKKSQVTFQLLYESWKRPGLNFTKKKKKAKAANTVLQTMAGFVRLVHAPSLSRLLNRAEVFVTDCWLSLQVLVNTACCFLILVAKLIQCVVFGPLRVSERQVRQQRHALGTVVFRRFWVRGRYGVLRGLADGTQEK